MQPTEQIVVANGLGHRVLTWDGGSDHTVLCLHGFLDLAWGFAPIAPALAAAGCHVVAPDLRGHGETERVGRGGYYHFFDYVHDVADLVDALARGRLSVVGHSMGAVIASLWAGAFPGRAERLALLEGMLVRDVPVEELPDRASAWITQVRHVRGRAPKVHADVAAAAARLRALDPRCPEDLSLFLAEKGTRAVEGGRVFLHDPLHTTRGPYAFRLEQARVYWQRITAPVLLVEADGSELPFPEDQRERYRSLAEARLWRLEGAGHMMIRHQPAPLARALLAFLAGGWPDGAERP